MEKKLHVMDVGDLWLAENIVKDTQDVYYNNYVYNQKDYKKYKRIYDVVYGTYDMYYKIKEAVKPYLKNKGGK